MTALDDLDRRLLDLLQAEFPLCRRPYEELARRAGCSAGEAIERVTSLRRRGLVRRVGGVIDSRRLGLAGTLVGMKVPPDRIDEVAGLVNALPNVTHNYLREHEYNLWFTVTAESPEAAGAVAAGLARETGIAEVLDLPSLRTFKLNVQLRFGRETSSATETQRRGAETRGPGVEDQASGVWHRASGVGRTAPSPCQGEGGGEGGSLSQPNGRARAPALSPRGRGIADSRGPRPHARLDEISAVERAVLAALEGDLPDGAEPFDQLAERAGVAVEEFLAAARRLLEAGYLRRVAALVNHLEAGFTANAMCVWRVPPERVAEAGSEMAAFDEVTHCYERPGSPEWPYALYCMIHGRTREETEAVARCIAEAVRPLDYRLLFSVRELKKRSLRPLADGLRPEGADEPAQRPLSPNF